MRAARPGLSRRQLLAGAAPAVLGTLAFVSAAGQAVVKDIRDLRPGEFTWHPERSPTGPVAVIVSIPDQRVHVYRNGIRIAVSTCSTGRPGHSTPSGVFTILQKDRHHRSSTYGGAPMPNMNRLTWSGIALHAGNLPGYPASHGCVRLPMEFSRLLFGVTHLGTPVILANTHSDPASIVHPGLILAESAQQRMSSAVAGIRLKGRPAQTHADNRVPPLSILVSSTDRRIVVMENGNVVIEGLADIARPSEALGSHVFVLSEARDGQLFWHGIGYHTESSASASDLAILQRIRTDDRVLAAIAEHLHVGAIMTTVDLPVTADSRTGRDFVVMAEAES